MTELQTVAIGRLQPSKTNPRQFFDKAFIAELVASIKEHGIIDPLLVRPTSNDHLEIIAGEQRYRAGKEAGLSEVPVFIRVMTDQEALEIQIIENDSRKDVHPLEQSNGYERLQREFKLTPEQLAKRVNKQPGYVKRRLQYQHLIEPIREMFARNTISQQHAFLAARLTSDQQKEIVKMKWLDRVDSAAQFASDIARTFFLILKEAPFDTADEKLVGKAGSCVNCPKRTGFNKALFEDVKNDDTCTDPACFEEKVRTFIKIQVATHKDAVLLSISDQYNNRSEPKHLTTWVKAGAKGCPDTKEGVVVEQTAFRALEAQAAKLGTVLKVCVNPKCKTHGSHVTHSASTETRNTAEKEAAKKRKVELRRRSLVFKELASNPFPVTEDDYRGILDHQVLQLSHDHAKAVCDAMEWPVETAKKGDATYQDLVGKNLAKLNARAVIQWILLLSLAEAELWFSFGSANKAKMLDAKAKQEGVPLDTIGKLARETKAEAKKRLKAESKTDKTAKK